MLAPAPQKLYTLQNARGDRLSFSLDRGLIWESWELQGNLGKSLFQHPASVIGPHAGSRKYLNEDLNEHQNEVDPFIDGVGAYAPWECLHATDTQLIAQLQGTKVLQDKTLASLEGQTFLLHVTITLTDQGALWKLAVRAESDGLIGLRCPILHHTHHHTCHSAIEEESSIPIKMDSPTTAHFLLKGSKYDMPGQIVAPNEEWSAEWSSTENSAEGSETVDLIDPTYSMQSQSPKQQQLIIYSARYPKQPILTINYVDVLFKFPSVNT